LIHRCASSSIHISKHRLNDDYIDCAHGDDESIEHDTCSLNLADRFQCISDQPPRCIPRVYISDDHIDCEDRSDESQFFSCNSPADLGCKWKRGTIKSIGNIEFTYVCDGFIHVSRNNITDETDCPSTWIHNCNSSFTRCDGYWHCRDGHDELGCEDLILISDPYYYQCMKDLQFYCVNQTDLKLVCYPPGLAGDGKEDCIGGIDERVGGFCHMT
jgi:hypothetical protein